MKFICKKFLSWPFFVLHEIYVGSGLAIHLKREMPMMFSKLLTKDYIDNFNTVVVVKTASYQATVTNFDLMF